jgi:ribonuclease J
MRKEVKNILDNSTYNNQENRPKVRVIPLGGLGEVGKNITVIEYEEDILIIDVGLSFPDPEHFGIDLIIPDISYLHGKEDRIRGIIITHGHEDHIGALPYILPQIPAPIYATRLTLGLIEVKLQEHKLMHLAEMHEVRSGDRVPLGPFEVEFFHVCHSIPDAVGVGVHTPEGTIVHTGDFKFDHSPVDGKPTDFSTLTRIGDEGVLLLLSDCVHVETPGHTPSEMEVSKTLENYIREAPGRILIATFGSLISRVQIILDLSYRYGRKVALTGRSLENNTAMAEQLGYLNVPPDTLISLQDMKRVPDRNMVIICTGAQGEPMAALNRIANGDNRRVSIVPGDTVILSATPIPGNETSVSRMVNNLFCQGADVVYSALARVHVSGHASQEELKLMLNLTRPRFVAPIHGERRHLVLYSRLARQLGWNADDIFLMDNGNVLEVDRDSCAVVDKVQAGEVFVDGLSVGEIGQVVLRDRQLLSRDGMMIVVVTVDRSNGELIAGPDIITRGFVYVRDAEPLIEQTKELVRETLTRETNGNGSHPSEWSFLTKKIRDTVSQYLYTQTHRSPMVLPMVMEL